MTVPAIDKQDNRLALGLLAVGILMLFGIGNLFLAVMMGGIFLLPGLLLMRVYDNGHESTAPFAVPGVLITGTGLLLVFQSLTGYWESWAYAWTLYGVFLGYGIKLMGQRLSDETLMSVGTGFMIAGGFGFLVFGGLIVLMSNGILQFMLPIMLISAGGYMLIKRSDDRPTPKVKNDAKTKNDYSVHTVDSDNITVEMV